MKRIGVTLLFCSLAGGSTHAEIRLDKLTACPDITAIYQSINDQGLWKDRGCRAARSDLERALLARHKSFYKKDLCFLKDGSTKLTNDFGCIYEKQHQQFGSLFCIKPAYKKDIDNYINEYHTKYAKLVNEYVIAASKCPVSNGDASIDGSPSRPYLLDLIGKLEFGFRLNLGKPMMDVDAAMIHGYAAMDPEIDHADFDAIEYIEISKGNSPSTTIKKLKEQEQLEKSSKNLVGAWTVLTDKSLGKEMAEGLRQANVAASIVYTGVSLKKEKDVADDVSIRTKAVEDGQKIYQKLLISEGFEVFSEGELERYTGMKYSEVEAMLSKKRKPYSIPYGAEPHRTLKAVTSKPVLLFNRKPMQCDGRNGFYMALINVATAQPEITSDYGDLDLLVLGLGSCGNSNNQAVAYLKNLEIEALENFTEFLKQ